MIIGLHAPYGPGTRHGWDAVHAAVALAEHAHVVAVPTEALPPGPYPPKFRNLLAGDEPHVRVLFGDPSSRALAHPCAVWAYPGLDESVSAGWDAVIATNRDAADRFGTADIAPIGVDTTGFSYKARRNRIVLVIGDRLPFLGDVMWRDPDRMTMRGLAHVFARASVAVCVQPKHAWAAARFAATGGCLIVPSDGDLANLAHPDWSYVLPDVDESTIIETVDDAVTHIDDTRSRGKQAASIVRTGMSWRACAGRMAMLMRRHL